MNPKRTADAIDSQGISTLIHITNWIRKDRLQKQLIELHKRKTAAFNEIRAMEKSIEHVIKSNRGGATGAHGYIGERAQTGIANARSLINGHGPRYYLIDDNGMTDYFRGGTPVQQKACISDKMLGLSHIKIHSHKYPEYVTVEKGIYQIPKDFYEKYIYYRDMPWETAGKLLKPELRLWKRIQDFTADNPNVQIEPMVVDYADIQVNTIGETISQERAALFRLDRNRRERAVSASKATLSEGIKVAIGSAAIESVVDGGLSVVAHMSDDKSIKEFDAEDWKEIGVDAAKGAGKGALRGGAVYALSNCTNMSAPAAGAAVSVAFSSSESASKYFSGAKTGRELAADIGKCCIEAMFYVVGAKAGAKYIKNPYLGSFVGGAVGTILFNLCERIADTTLGDAAAA